MAWLDQRGIAYERIDVIADADAYDEMHRVSGPTSAPAIQVDGRVLADFGADELAAWWEEQGFDG